MKVGTGGGNFKKQNHMGEKNEPVQSRPPPLAQAPPPHIGKGKFTVQKHVKL